MTLSADRQALTPNPFFHFSSSALVSHSEIDLLNFFDSPMAKALLGKREDDEVEVKKPNGTTTFYVISVKY